MGWVGSVLVNGWWHRIDALILRITPQLSTTRLQRIIRRSRRVYRQNEFIAGLFGLAA